MERCQLVLPSVISIHSTLHGKHSLLFPSDGMPDRTLPSQKAYFFFFSPSLKHGVAFDNVAVQATSCSVTPEAWAADVLFPRKALVWPLQPRELLSVCFLFVFRKEDDPILSFAQVQTVH